MRSMEQRRMTLGTRRNSTGLVEMQMLATGFADQRSGPGYFAGTLSLLAFPFPFSFVS